MKKRHFGVYCTFWMFCYRRLITRNKWLELKLIRSREKNIFNFPQQNYLSLLQSVLKELLCEKLPKLAIHFGEFHKNTKLSLECFTQTSKKIFAPIHILESHGVDPALFSLNWFLCLFVEYLPVNTYLHIWDAFLFEGSKVNHI